MKRGKKTPKAKIKLECDKLWSRLTKEIHYAKHGRICLWCKKPTNNLQSDHIVNRWKHATRWRVENCVVLCVGCHLFRKKRDPLGWAEMVREDIGDEKLGILKEMSDRIFKIDTINLNDVLSYLETLDKDKPWINGRMQCPVEP